jgi:hypothetical protein
MPLNITQEFLQELHQQTKDIPKLQYLSIRIPVYNTNAIMGLHKYFKDIATFDADQAGNPNQTYQYKNIKLLVMPESRYGVERSSISFYAKFEGASSAYRILDTVYRNNNFTVGGFRLPFSYLGFATAKAMLDDAYRPDVARYASSSEQRTINGFFNDDPDVETQSTVVRRNARIHELAVIDIMKALYDTTIFTYKRIGEFVHKNHHFNTFTAFDTYYARYHPKAYTIRQLGNLNGFIPELGSLQINLLATNDRDYENNDSQLIMSSNNSSFSFTSYKMFKENKDMHSFVNDKLYDLIVRLPYNIMFNPLDVITKPTNNVEYFSKAIPDINFFYILNDKYIDLRSAVIPSFKDEFVGELKKLHDNYFNDRRLMMDSFTHHYDTSHIFSFLGNEDREKVYGNVDNFYTRTSKPELRYAVDSTVITPHYIELFDLTYYNHIKPHITKNNSCAMCKSRENVLDTSLIADDVLYSRDMITPLFKKPQPQSNMFVGHSGHTICENCKLQYNHQMQRYNGFFDRDDCFIGPDSVDEAIDREIYRIHSYDYRPNDMLFVRQDDELETELHLGIELEIDDPDYREDGYYDDEEDEYVDDSGGSASLNPDEAASMFINTLSKGLPTSYAMTDGSLHYGFEIATVPATLKAHLDSQYFDYAKAFDKVIKANYRSHETRTCGIHVHMDRSFFGSRRSEQLYRAAIMAYILERNWVDVSRFSRRKIHNLEQWAKKKNLESFISHMDSVERAGDKFLVEYDGDKYVMLNTLHRNSFELRIFRGTLNLITYKATLQFVDNLARLAKSVDVAKAQQITFKDIVNYNPHPELVTYVNTRFGENYLGE